MRSCTPPNAARLSRFGLSGQIQCPLTDLRAARYVLVEMGESRTPRPEPFAGIQLRAYPMICRRPPGRASALCPAVQSRAPRSGLSPDYVTLVRTASSLDDASTTHEEEAASTLTLPPKRRERESTGGCQVLLFAAFLRGQTAPRLAFPGIQALSNPHIPRTNACSPFGRNPSSQRRRRQAPFVGVLASPPLRPDVTDSEAIGKGVRGVDDVARQAGDPGLATGEREPRMLLRPR